MPRSMPPLTISNNKVIVIWIFMAVWLSFLGCFTYLFVTAGAPPEAGISGWAILAMFWLFGLGATRWALAQPRIRVTVARREVVTRESWLWRARERRVRCPQWSQCRPTQVNKQGRISAKSGRPFAPH
jgi:uncharacterized membrane protein